jgi:hypothetical protein
LIIVALKDYSMRSILVAALAVYGLVVTEPEHAETASLAVHDPWVAEAPPGAKVMAAYMVLENLSDQDQILTKVSSPSFDKAEVHRTEVREGMARMVPVEQMTIEPHAKAVFEPGGHHLMLVGPHQPLREGDVVVLGLEFEGGERMSAHAPVRKAKPGGEAHHHHH